VLLSTVPSAFRYFVDVLPDFIYAEVYKLLSTDNFSAGVCIPILILLPEIVATTVLLIPKLRISFC